MSMTTTGSGPKLSWLSVKNASSQKILAWLTLVGVGAAVYVWVLPFVLVIASMTVKLIILGFIAWVMLMFLANARFRWAIGFLVQRLINALVTGIIKRDPVGVMKNYLREVDENLVKLSDRIGEIRGAITKAKSDLQNDTNEKEASEQILLGHKRNGTTDSASARTEANKIRRREQSIARMTAEIQQGEAIIAFLGRYHEQAQAYREDLKDNILFTERERKRVKTSAAAFRAVKSILKGGSVGAEMYEEANEYAREDAARFVGEMQQFVSESQGALESFSLQQDGAVQQVLARLEEKGKDSLLLGYQPGTPVPMAAGGERESVATSVDRFLNL